MPMLPRLLSVTGAFSMCWGAFSPGGFRPQGIFELYVLLLGVDRVRRSTTVGVHRHAECLELLCRKREMTRSAELQVRSTLRCPDVADRKSVIRHVLVDTKTVKPALSCTGIEQLDIALVEDRTKEFIPWRGCRNWR